MADTELTALEALRIQEAHRVAAETFLIVVAAKHRRRAVRRDDLFTRAKLAIMLQGAEIEAGANGAARDIQFELYVGAQLHLGGLAVSGGEPDLRLTYGAADVGVAAKRIRSRSPAQLERHIDKVALQIQGAGGRGWIAMNLDSRFSGISLERPEEALLREFEQKLDSANDALQRQAHNAELLGFMAFGHIDGWRRDSNCAESLRLHSATVTRWVLWSDNPQERELFRQFVDGWEARYHRNLRTILSPTFDGYL